LKNFKGSYFLGVVGLCDRLMLKWVAIAIAIAIVNWIELCQASD
jgi:hypothetical protein